MGSYLPKNMTNADVITLTDCKTQSDCEHLFIIFNDIHPNEYCKLALTKLKDLTDLQKQELNDIITSDVNKTFKWRRYCSNLNVHQINFVGW